MSAGTRNEARPRAPGVDAQLGRTPLRDGAHPWSDAGHRVRRDRRPSSPHSTALNAARCLRGDQYQDQDPARVGLGTRAGPRHQAGCAGSSGARDPAATIRSQPSPTLPAAEPCGDHRCRAAGAKRLRMVDQVSRVRAATCGTRCVAIQEPPVPSTSEGTVLGQRDVLSAGSDIASGAGWVAAQLARSLNFPSVGLPSSAL